MIVNEHGDYFWLDRGSFGIRASSSPRAAGLAGESASGAWPASPRPLHAGLLLAFAAKDT